MVRLMQHLTLKNKYKQGLTIIETLIAISVISTVIGIAVILVVNISNYSSSAEVRSIAVNFAQEALDIVKNVRDNDYCRFFSTAYPNNRWYRASCAAGSCTLSAPSSTILWDIGSYNTTILQNATGNIRRSVQIVAAPGAPVNEGKRVIVNVEWETKGSGGMDTYTLITDLYKWKY